MDQGNYPTAERPLMDGTVNSYAGMQDRPQMETASIPQPLSPAPRPINIQPVNHGFLVTVGCQTFAIEKLSTLIRNLEKYLENPSEVEKKWLSGKMEL